MRAKIDQRENETKTGQTAAEARRLFEKVTFSLDVFSRIVSPSHAKRSLLEAKKPTTTNHTVLRSTILPQRHVNFLKKLQYLRCGLRATWSPDNNNNLY